MTRLAPVAFAALLSATLAAQGPQAPLGGGRGGPGGRGPGFDLFAMIGRKVVTDAPFSASQSTSRQQTLGTGNQIVRQEQGSISRDSQGRVRIERTLIGTNGSSQNTPKTMVTIVDPVAGVIYSLDQSTMTAVQFPFRQSDGDHASADGRHGGNGRSGNRAGHRPEVQREDLGTELISGVTATGTRTTETIPAGVIGNQAPIQVVREVWTSPDLQIPVRATSSDPRGGNTVMEVSNIVQGEPDARLFEVPSNYTTTTRQGRGRELSR